MAMDLDGGVLANKEFVSVLLIHLGSEDCILSQPHCLCSLKLAWRHFKRRSRAQKTRTWG